ncbi:hypothetical protein [Dethiosulfatarculus sandiegensis]|uniref:Uncharacterized protein n=1 Tax=Dethiosulfatarculus sandiegensis TaxID=1429043 RepID=A0A0D2J4J1_9BACT|nr:hypothetical protein [Dethiosulfatarculus sandiegensis]KIX13009.1 hypothetical protein X474_16350 [Dethiosulfatarculus sandiegensis]
MAGMICICKVRDVAAWAYGLFFGVSNIAQNWAADTQICVDVENKNEFD